MADYKSFVEDKLTLVMKKKSSAGVFTDMATLVQKRYAEEWFNDAVICERGMCAMRPETCEIATQRSQLTV